MPTTDNRVAVIIPALNEENALDLLLADMSADLHIIVVDNGSTDGTAEVARRRGALVVSQPRRGYGFACLAGIAALPEDIDIVAFCDAGYSEDPRQLSGVIDPIREGRADLVMGSRTNSARSQAAKPWHAMFGNWLASTLMRLLYGLHVTDNSPFRAIRRDALEHLQMQPAAFRWTTEMLVKAARLGLRVHEIPITCRPRTGRSKVSGTIKGSVLAAYYILSTIALYVWWRPSHARS